MVLKINNASNLAESGGDALTKLDKLIQRQPRPMGPPTRQAREIRQAGDATAAAAAPASDAADPAQDTPGARAAADQADAGDDEEQHATRAGAQPDTQPAAQPLALDPEDPEAVEQYIDALQNGGLAEAQPSDELHGGLTPDKVARLLDLM
jgi:hypothetical protein